jgi:hypothetical protein
MLHSCACSLRCKTPAWLEHKKNFFVLLRQTRLFSLFFNLWGH